MKLVVGLGNPGDRYARTRHNAGFLVADLLLQRATPPSSFRTAFDGLVARARIGREEAVILKPQTFMNLSGRSVRAASTFYKIPGDDLVVLHDDLDLQLGVVRVKVGGGTAGHRGLESCVAELGTAGFCRVRIGIGRPPPGHDPADYVLTEFRPEERSLVPDLLGLAADATELTLAQGAVAAMNRFNRRGQQAQEEPE